jgi:hypothetical protein
MAVSGDFRGRRCGDFRGRRQQAPTDSLVDLVRHMDIHVISGSRLWRVRDVLRVPLLVTKLFLYLVRRSSCGGRLNMREAVRGTPWDHAHRTVGGESQ